MTEDQKETDTAELLDKVISTLCGYSMLNYQTEQKEFSIHRMVQQVIHSNLQAQKKPQEFRSQFLITKLLMSLNRSCPDGQKMQVILNRRKWINHFETVISHCKKYVDSPHQKEFFSSAISKLIDIYINDSMEFHLVKMHVEHLLKIFETLFQMNLRYAEMLTTLGIIYVELGFPKRAKPLLELSFSIKKKFYGDDKHLGLVDTLRYLAIAEGHLVVDQRKTHQFLGWALSILQTQEQKDYSKIAIIKINLGISYSQMNPPQLERAKVSLEEALQLQTSLYGLDHIRTAEALSSLGPVYGTLGTNDKAVELLDQALKIEEKYYGEQHFRVFKILSHLGRIYVNLNRLPEALVTLQRALEVAKKHYVLHENGECFEMIPCLVTLGSVYNKMKRPKEAILLLQQALQINADYYKYQNEAQTVAISIHLEKSCSMLGLGKTQTVEQIVPFCLPQLDKNSHLGSDTALQ